MPIQGARNRGPGNLPAGLLSAAPFLAVLISWLIWRDQLPDEIGTQWSGDTVSSQQPTLIVVLVFGSVTLIAAVIAFLSALEPISESQSARPFLVAGIVSGIAAGAWFVLAGLAVADDSAVGQPVGWGLLALLAGGFGFVPYSVARKTIQSETHEVRAGSLDPHDTVAWTGRTTAPSFIAIAVLAVAAAIVLAVSGVSEGWNGASITGIVAMGVLALFSIVFSAIRVSVDHRGIRVVSLPTGITLKSIPPEQVARVQVSTVSPMAWGGWGYRIMPGRSAIVLRGGESISLILKNDKEFAVTVADADAGAETLSSLVTAPRS